MALHRKSKKQTITDADYTDNIALLAKTPAQAESLLHSLEKAASGIYKLVGWLVYGVSALFGLFNT